MDTIYSIKDLYKDINKYIIFKHWYIFEVVMLYKNGFYFIHFI